MKFSSVEMEGSLIPPETLDEIVIGAAPGQRPQDFGLSKKTDLDNEIAASWSDARGYWAVFKAAQTKSEKDKSSVFLTRDLWMLPMLRSFGFTDIAVSQEAAIVNLKSSISHRIGDADVGLPIHIDGSTNEIDKRPSTGRPRIYRHP
jgi:hypothetical protein